jgi:hypothetical protein
LQDKLDIICIKTSGVCINCTLTLVTRYILLIGMMFHKSFLGLKYYNNLNNPRVHVLSCGTSQNYKADPQCQEVFNHIAVANKNRMMQI